MISENKNQDEAFLNDKIDLAIFFKELSIRKYLILSITTIGTLLFVIFALLQPDVYKSSALLKVNSDSTNSSSMLNSYQGIASLAGINLPSGRGVEKTELAIEIIKSRSFINRIINNHDVKKQLVSSSKFNKDKNILIYDDSIDLSDVSDLDVHEIYIDEYLKVSKNKQNFVTVSISHVSPLFAHELLNIVIEELNMTVKEKDLKDSSDAMEYLNELLPKIRIQEVKNSINKIIEQQLEIMMLSSIKSDYILEYVDPPYIPQSKDGPERILISMLGFIISLIFSIILAVSLNKFNRQKSF